jgi:hypothetical protein
VQVCDVTHITWPEIMAHGDLAIEGGLAHDALAYVEDE